MLRIILSKIISSFKLPIFKLRWIRNNKHNKTIPENVFNIKKVKVGNYTYGKLNIHMFDNPKEGLNIGHFCSIGGNVMFILGGNHPYNTISTYPIKNKILEENVVEAETKGKIVVESDVWIGERSTILSGVTIGQGAIIGAGSIVSKDVPPYAIYIGNKIVKYRFSEEIRNKLLQIDFGKLTKDYMKKNVQYFYQEVGENLLEKAEIRQLRS